MDIDTKFSELLRTFIEQYRLSPEIADALLQKILQILSDNADEHEAQSHE